MKDTDRIREYARKTPVFDTSSVVRLIGDANYAYLLLNLLMKRGELKRITKGYYTIHDDPSLFVYCIKPAYFGLEDAMSFRDIWEQETNAVILTTRKVRPGTRKVLGGNVILRRISPRLFFGYDYIRQGELVLPVSDVEKTFLDMLHFNKMRKDMLPAFLARMDRERLMQYLKRYDKAFRKRALKLIG